MRAAVFRAPGILRVELRPDPAPRPGEVLVRVRRCGIGEIDLGLTSGGPFDVAYGSIVGRECTGEVVALGAGVDTLRLGDRVATWASGGCGRCAICMSGQRPLCPAGMRQGAFASFVPVAAAHALLLDDRVDFAAGALLTPLATGLHGVQAVNDRRPNAVVVLGDGAVALSVVFWARRIWGCEVRVLSNSAAGGALAKRLGAELVVPADSTSHVELADVFGRPDVVFECVGAPGSLQQTVGLVARGGRVVSLGFAVEPSPISPRSARAKGLRIDFPYGCTFKEFEEASAAMSAAPDELARMVSSVVTLDQLSAAFKLLRGLHGETKVQLAFT